MSKKLIVLDADMLITSKFEVRGVSSSMKIAANIELDGNNRFISGLMSNPQEAHHAASKGYVDIETAKAIQGLQGIAGPTGPTGLDGAIGAAGATGPAGAAGPPGPAGTNGTDGAAGPVGVAGATGSQGPVGATGTGLIGETGAQGIPGVNGAAGLDGVNGAAGLDGATGAAGATGPAGAAGPPGAAGLNGATGATGATGAAGAAGPPGAAGSNGTNGATGPAGTDGINGATGPAGIQGIQGATGPAGSGSSVIVSNTTTSNVQRLLFTNTVTGSTATTLNTHANSLQYTPSSNVLSSTGNITAASFTGSLTGNASSATQIASTNSSSTTLHYLAFSDVNGGSTSLKTATALTYTPGESGGATLRVPKIVATGDISAGSFTGLASDASQVVTTNTSSTTARYLCISPNDNNSPNPADIQTATALTYTPGETGGGTLRVPKILATGDITAASFTGLASDASQVVTANTASTTARYLCISPNDNTTPNPADIQTATALTYTPGETGGGTLRVPKVSATTFTGALTGNASSATQVTATNSASDIAQFITFVANNNSTAAASDIRTGTSLTYKPLSGLLTATGVSATTFTGALTGNASSATKASTVRDATNLSRYIIFSPNDNASTAAADLMTATQLSYNPSSGLLTVPSLNVTGSLSATVSSATNLAGGTTMSIPYQSAAGTTAFLANGALNAILTSSGGTIAPKWQAASLIVRGYQVPFSSGGTAANYLYANSGAIGITSTTVSGVTTKFVCPIVGSIEAVTFVWAIGHATATVSIILNGVNVTPAYTSGAIFGAATGTATVTSGLFIGVSVGSIIEVRTNAANLGNMTAVLYFT